MSRTIKEKLYGRRFVVLTKAVMGVRRLMMGGGVASHPSLLSVVTTRKELTLSGASDL